MKNGKKWNMKMKKKINKYFSYKELFLEDIVRSIEVSIMLNNNAEKNIEIENIKGDFKSYFLYKNSTYLRYDFLEEVARLIGNVIEKGRAEAIIVKFKNETNVVEGIEIRLPYYDFKLQGIKNMYFIQKQNIIGTNKKYYATKVKKDEIISINSRDLNINRFKMKKILRNLEKDSMTNELLMLIQKNLLYYGEFEKIKEKEKIRLFKDTNEIRWDARDSGSEYLNSPYIFYRNVEFYKYLINLLNITIDIINRKLSNQKDCWILERAFISQVITNRRRNGRFALLPDGKKAIPQYPYSVLMRMNLKNSMYYFLKRQTKIGLDM